MADREAGELPGVNGKLSPRVVPGRITQVPPALNIEREGHRLPVSHSEICRKPFHCQTTSTTMKW